jgi:RNA polymerase sigma-70 factor (ECF subfamily)
MEPAAVREHPVNGERDRAPTSSDAADARRAAKGDPEAFERLYHAHVARIHSLARRMLGEQDADEATQDAFVRAWEKLGTFRGDAAFGTWLHRLAINLFLGQRAKRARLRERMQGGQELIEVAESKRNGLELHIDFEKAIGRLPAGAREVFVLHDVEGYKHREIAEMIGVTTGTTKAQLHRARMALRGYVER